MPRLPALAALFGGAFALLLPAAALADVVFDTITPTGVTTGGSGVFVGTTDSINYERAASFTVPGPDDFTLDGVDLLLDDGGTEVRVRENNVDEPGAILDSGLAPGSPVVDDLFSVPLSAGATLQAGETYWISVYRATGSTAWRYTSNGPYFTGDRMNNENGGPWQDSSPRTGSLYGFVVHGTPLPEPGAAGFAAGCAALLALRARRQPRQSKVRAAR